MKAAVSAWVMVPASSEVVTPGETTVTRTLSVSWRSASEITRTAYLVAQ